MKLTPNQFAILKSISLGKFYEGMNDLRKINNLTMYSLFTRGYIWIDSKSNLIITQEGLDALQSYSHAAVPYRKTEGAVSKGVARILHLKKEKAYHA